MDKCARRRHWVCAAVFALSGSTPAPAFAQDLPGLSVADAAAGEADGTIDFAVSLSVSASAEVSVDYATATGEADAGDFTSASGTLAFAAGTVEQTISVSLIDDSLDELPETFELTLSDPAGATIDDGTATGTIEDDDPEPIMDFTGYFGFFITEGWEGEVSMQLSQPSGRTVTLDYETEPWGTNPATAGSDYVQLSGSLTFNPGETEKTIAVTILDDEVYEGEEFFYLRFRNLQGARFDRRFWDNGSELVMTANFYVADSRPVPGVTIADAADLESAGELAFPVTLSGPIEDEVSMTYSTADGTAVAGEDYTARENVTLWFQPGDTRRTVRIPILDDSLSETATKTFSINLSQNYQPLADSVGDLQATGTIQDDDGETSLFIGDASAFEGDGELSFSVTLGGQSSAAVTVNYATADGTATAGRDYRAAAGTLTLAPGETHQTITVALLDDNTYEPSKTFSVSLSGAVGALVDDGTGTGTIHDDENFPLVTIHGSRGPENGLLDFRVTVSPATEQTVSVDYVTDDGFEAHDPPAYRLADPGSDFTYQAGTLTFTPGETSKTIRVQVLDDLLDEPTEAVVVTLENPVNAEFVSREPSDTCPWSGCDQFACCDCGTITDNDEDDEDDGEDDGDRADKASTKGRALLFEATTRAGRQGFVRVINHSDVAGEILVEGIDDSGMRVGPLTFPVGAGMARHFNSDDFEGGNADKGLVFGVGPPSLGSWRLELSSELDIEVLSYARTADGFVTSLHDTAPATAGEHRAVFLNPGGNVDQVSRLRLINPGTQGALVTITGTDDMGGMSTEVVVDLPAGTAREWTAAELESGTGANGALGDGEGKWRLRLSSDRPVVAMSLIESPAGNLTNLSTLPRTPGRTPGSHAVPLFPSASDAKGRQGFVRLVNRAGTSEMARIEAFDRTDRTYEPLALAVGADEVASFNSDDLELGNRAKGLTGSTGAGEGDWWLELSSDADIEVASYIRTTDGFLTSMHDLVPEAEGVHRVVFFNPGENVNQVSVLWLVNPGNADAAVTITGVDDNALTPGTPVRLTVPAGSSRRLTSAELETGESEAIDQGALGDGEGKWRLRVESDRPVRVMSLLENPTGHLTNLSTAPGGL